MASIGEIVGQLQTVIDEINDTVTAAAAAASTTDELQGQMAAADMQDKVAALGALKDTIEKLSGHVAGGLDIANEAITQARAIGTGSGT
jgi:hypothetical protein